MKRAPTAEQPARILIVDDEPHNRTLLEVMLGAEGFRLAVATNGEQALAMIAEDPPDLVVLDVMMPGMGGYEVAGKLKGNPVTKHIPIIMVTALDDHSAKLFGLTSGAEEFLTKPLDRVELCMRVRNLLRLKGVSDVAIAHRDHSLGMVSHDLRNLLNGIVVTATTLGETDAAAAETVEACKRILAYAARMDRLVEDLVDVASLDAGKPAIKPARTDAVALLAEAVESCTHAAAANGISVRAETVEATLLGMFDRERMLQVLGNLITNALKFTRQGGSIVLRGARDEHGIRLSVSDTGTGIPESMLDAVFTRFTQVEHDDHRGLGLGLFISRGIVESHGGRMWVESKLGEGSTFYFTIPDALPTTVAPPRVPAVIRARRPSSPCKILIVDDDQAMGETLALHLKRRGYDATWRSNAREALALLETSIFHVVMTDLNMEEMNGLVFCARVVAMRPGLPVIVTTGLGGADARIASLGAGAYDFLVKPLDLALLRTTLDRAVLQGS